MAFRLTCSRQAHKRLVRRSDHSNERQHGHDGALRTSAAPKVVDPSTPTSCSHMVTRSFIVRIFIRGSPSGKVIATICCRQRRWISAASEISSISYVVSWRHGVYTTSSSQTGHPADRTPSVAALGFVGKLTISNCMYIAGASLDSGRCLVYGTPRALTSVSRSWGAGGLRVLSSDGSVVSASMALLARALSECMLLSRISVGVEVLRIG